MSFNIEKNVPLPEKNVRWKYPFDQMEVGDSFFVVNKDTVPTRRMQQVRLCCVRHLRRAWFMLLLLHAPR